MRKFKISNEIGETHYLQNDIAFFWQPSGLGFGNNNTYEATDGYFLRIKSEQTQTPKSGTLVFKPQNAYADYQKIMQFLTTAKALTLGYKPYGDTWYSCDVEVLSVDKGEKTSCGTLEIPITFMPISPIYLPEITTLQILGKTSGGKKYAYSYPFVYSNASQAGSIQLNISDAQMPCDFAFEITKPVSAPVITVAEVESNKVIGRVDLSAITVESGQKVRFSTKPTEAGVLLINADGTNEDLTPFLGLSSGVPTFFQLPIKTPLQMRLTAVSLEDVQVNIRVFKYYRTA